MQPLQEVLAKKGFTNITTYIQSGNIVLQHRATPNEEVIASIITANFGFKPAVLIYSANQFATIVQNNPYQGFEGKFVHCYFCDQKPKLQLEKLTKYQANTERYTVVGNVFYLHAPDGLARSKLVANIDACLTVTNTGRNLNTVNKLQNIIETTALAT